MGALKFRVSCETLTPFESASDRRATPRMWRRRDGAAHPPFKSRGATNMREQYQHVFVHSRPLGRWIQYPVREMLRCLRFKRERGSELPGWVQPQQACSRQAYCCRPPTIAGGRATEVARLDR